jgi:hypothetical protein
MKELLPLSVPEDLKIFEESTSLLPGENRQKFEVIKKMIINDIRPKTNLEWLWVLDLVELSWEILRYRRMKEKILEIQRVDAIASILQRLDGVGMPSQRQTFVQSCSRRSSVEWREDSAAASEIEARLTACGFDAAAINAEVFLLAQIPFGFFDGLMQSAQSRRINLLREITVHRLLESRNKSKTPQ